MKNVIKKIAAAAMAFTLLGAGTAITNTVAPQLAETTISASAAHNCAAHVRYTNNAQYTGVKIKYANGRVKKQYVIVESSYCITCGRQVSQRSWVEWRWA